MKTAWSFRAHPIGVGIWSKLHIDCRKKSSSCFWIAGLPETFLRLQNIFQWFLRTQQSCLAVTLQKCFVDFNFIDHLTNIRMNCHSFMNCSFKVRFVNPFQISAHISLVDYFLYPKNCSSIRLLFSGCKYILWHMKYFFENYRYWIKTVKSK